MALLTEKIYYITALLFDGIERDFVLIERGPWAELYCYNADGTYWRLDTWDKLQEQYLVRIDDLANWTNFDATELQIEQLRNTRGVTPRTCTWNGCSKKELTDLAYYEQHAFIEMGICL